jgi:hypothetical protein
VSTCAHDRHANEHANGATHLAPDVRPQSFRHRIDTPTLRGAHIQRLFGSQRALKSIEDFTEFEQGAAYFDGDHVIAAEKGINHLERATRVSFMAEFQELLDFPPAPKLKINGMLDPRKATDSEIQDRNSSSAKRTVRAAMSRSPGTRPTCWPPTLASLRPCSRSSHETTCSSPRRRHCLTGIASSQSTPGATVLVAVQPVGWVGEWHENPKPLILQQSVPTFRV